jgi:energy-coupling factor transporter ATP-binding protein EcfA2
MNIENTLLKNFIPSEIAPEEKKEHELNNSDRMHLINKKLDENFLSEIYNNIINRKNFIKNENIVDVNDYVYNDIEFLHDHYLNEQCGIFTKLNKCKTKIGALLLKKILLKPIYDINVLKERQNILLKICNAKNELLPLLDKINLLENDLIWFWNDANMKHIDLMDDLIYFNYNIIPFFNVNDVLNNNQNALLVSNIYKIVVSPVITILTPIVSLLLPLIFVFYLQRKSPIKIPISEIAKKYFQTLFSNDSMSIIFKNPSKAMIASFITKGIYLFMYIQNIYYSLQSSNNTNKIINIIHDKLNKMSQYTKISNNIKNILEKYKIFNLDALMNYNKIQDDLTIYDEYFNFPVFNNDPSLFSNKGKILYVFKEFKKNKDKMGNIFHISGIIDALLSIDNIITNKTSENPYCLTTYLDKNQPCININNLWHPYLTNKNTVKNNVDIKKNILITGPNAAGKSTFIKAVIINIILAQTIGICSAEKFEITPFHLIETYLHIPDSKGSSSLFEAEMYRSKEYIDKIKNLNENKFSFIVLDEIFSSTNYIEGFSGAYSIIKKISSFPNVLSMTTTHYTDLEILEKDTNGKVINYKFDVDYDENNEIIFNYLLKKGVSRQYIALELLKKNGFDDDVIETALEICKKIKKEKIYGKKSNKKTKKEYK